MEQPTATTSPAETVRIDHPHASYGIFCFNPDGDLFLNSDWGFYAYAWRAYGESFKKFLAGCNAGYITQKLGMCYREMSGKKLPPYREEKLMLLVTAFIEELKTQIPNV